MSAIDHLHILPVGEAVDAGNDVVVKCGAAEGGSLGDAVSMRGILTPGEAVTACAPIAEALAQIHPHGIFHGGITVNDIVFTLDGRPMLAGIGMAQLGVPQRDIVPMAPEIASGSPPSPASDVYALAAVGAMLLTGNVPHGPVSLPGVQPAVMSVVNRALERAPERRPDATMLSNAVYAIASPEPVEIIASTEDTGAFPTVAPSPEFTEEMSEDDDVAAFMRGEDLAETRKKSKRGKAKDGGKKRGKRGGGAGKAAGAAAAGPAASPGTAGAPRDVEDTRFTRPVNVNMGASSAKQPPGRPAGQPAPGDDDRVRDASHAPQRQRSERGGGKPKSPRRTSGFDITKVAIAAIVVLVGFGVFLLVRQIMDGDPAADGSDPSTVTSTPSDLCGGKQPAPTAAPDEVNDWAAEVQRLYTLRVRAFEEGDASLLCQVYAPESESLAKDALAMEGFVDKGQRADGLSMVVIDVELVSQQSGRVELEITDEMSAYDVVDEDGEVVSTQEAEPENTWVAELIAVATEDGTVGWRLS